jgi:hypothetical protein
MYSCFMPSLLNKLEMKAHTAVRVCPSMRKLSREPLGGGRQQFLLCIQTKNNITSASIYLSDISAT